MFFRILARARFRPFLIMLLAAMGTVFGQGNDSVSSGGQDASTAGGFPTFTGPLRAPHPDYRGISLTPEGFAFKVTGMDWMSNGDLALLTISDPVSPDAGGGFGSVSRLRGARAAVSHALQAEGLYQGFRVPLGLAVADDSIYVSDFDGLHRLADNDGDGRIDALRTVLKYPGKASYSLGTWNMALIRAGDRFYTAMGAYHYVDSASNQGACRPDGERGKVHVSDGTGHVASLGSGLREPNGLVMGTDGELFATDNDGEWVPSNKLVHIRKDAFYGVCVGTSWDPALIYARPAVWFPDYLRSPGQPILMPSGRYRGQLFVGDYEMIVLSRIFLEKVDGAYQGALFPFTGGLISGATRLAVDPEGDLYLGEMEIEYDDPWWYKGDPRDRPNHIGDGLEKMIPERDSAFEMLSIRATPKGFAIEFTRPAGPSAALPDRYRIRQWRYLPSFHYGGPKLDLETLPVLTASLSQDGMTATLEIPGLKPDHMVHIQLHRDLRSRAGREPWAYEAWYTLNAIPGREIPVRPSGSAGRISAYEVGRGSGGGPELRVTLRERYSLEVRNLKGKKVLEAGADGPGAFPLAKTLSQDVLILTIRTRDQAYRGIIRPF